MLLLSSLEEGLGMWIEVVGEIRRLSLPFSL